jgi:putative FmdB family regulatory protein
MSPLYDYRCPNDACDKRFESLTQPWEPVRCPECFSYPCERQISAPSNYQIKGDNSASTRPKGKGGSG